MESVAYEEVTAFRLRRLRRSMQTVFTSVINLNIPDVFMFVAVTGGMNCCLAL